MGWMRKLDADPCRRCRRWWSAQWPEYWPANTGCYHPSPPMWGTGHQPDETKPVGDQETDQAKNGPNTGDIAGETTDAPDELDNFPRDYVEGLQAENAKYRTHAQHTDRARQRLHAELVGHRTA